MSAHWQTTSLLISTKSHLSTWHDYQIPRKVLHANTKPNYWREKYDISHMRQLKYRAPGEPKLAQRVIDWLHKNQIDAHADNLRPQDHGVWVPLLHMYPEANIPVVQLSLPTYFDAHACYQLGGALAHLRSEQILVIGSGNITHNLSELDWHQTDKIVSAQANAFKHWMIDKLNHDRPMALNWYLAPYAKQNHPTKEHLMPLFFSAGVAQRFSVVHSSFDMGSLGMDIYRFD